MIEQGEVFWVDLAKPSKSGPGYLRPFVVVQNNLFNPSRIDTVVVCAITSDIDRAKAPGNVLLDGSEAGLPKRSVVNVSQLFTVDKRDLARKAGKLSGERMREVLDGIELLLEPREAKYSGAGLREGP